MYIDQLNGGMMLQLKMPIKLLETPWKAPATKKPLIKHQNPLGNPGVSISSCQRNLMKTYHNEAYTSGITKIASKKFLEFFKQSS